MRIPNSFSQSLRWIPFITVGCCNVKCFQSGGAWHFRDLAENSWTNQCSSNSGNGDTPLKGRAESIYLFCILSVLVIYFKLLCISNKLKLIIYLNTSIKYTHTHNDRFKCYWCTGLLGIDTGVVHFHLSVRIIIAVFW